MSNVGHRLKIIIDKEILNVVENSVLVFAVLNSRQEETI